MLIGCQSGVREIIPSVMVQVPGSLTSPGLVIGRSLLHSGPDEGDQVAHRTFFSFHYEKDGTRANVVRNSSKLKTEITPEWIDASLWKKTKKQSDDAIKKTHC